MEDQQFEVKGSFLMGEEWMPYTKIIAAPNERQAQERTLTLMGSKHNLKRRYIIVDAITAVQ